MSDATTLRTLLTRVDATAPGIQSCAASMMKHYDRSSGVAVVEWRNALHNSNREQWIPLIYVANEVLQNSKRNRGNKFLEAFSPILGQSLIFVCQHSDAPIVEKIRRTVKIWGDRRVFSVRYVNELLKGLEPYRNNRNASNAPIIQPQQQQQYPPDQSSSPQYQQQQPATTTPSPHQSAVAATNNNQNKEESSSSPSANATNNQNENGVSNNKGDDDDDDDPMDIFSDENNEDDNDSDESSNVFGDSDDDGEDGGGKIGNIIDVGQLADVGQQQRGSFTGGSGKNNIVGGGNRKRRRSSTASSGSQLSASKRAARRKSVLSTTSLVELWKRVAELEQNFDHSMTVVNDIQKLPDPTELESLVGSELLDNHKMIVKYQEQITQQRQNLHSIATERKTMEQEAMRYIPWLEASLKQDSDDLEFCKKLESSLLKFQHVHPSIRKARDKRVAEDLKYQRDQEEKERKRKEEEESKKFRESALSKETEAKPGMVWNKVTQEYQYLNTDESWRD